MSSEAAAYFPDALASAPETGPSPHAKSEAPIRLLPDVQFRDETLEHPLGTHTTIDEISDEKLLEQIREGIKEPLALLFRRHARRVRNVIHRILRNESEADDLVQEVFLFIFRKAQLFDSAKGSARSWIVQIAYHRAIDRRRHLISRHFYDRIDLEDPAAVALGVEIAFYERSLEGMLGKAALKEMEESLSLDQRETLTLYFFEGYTVEEIAARLGQSVGNVRHHYYRALEKIRGLAFATKLRSK